MGKEKDLFNGLDIEEVENSSNETTEEMNIEIPRPQDDSQNEQEDNTQENQAIADGDNTQESDNKINKKLADEIKNLREQLKEIGIFFDDADRKDIFNYAKAKNSFNEILNDQKNLFEGMKVSFSGDERVLNFLKPMEENIPKIENFFSAIMSFFVSPPSKEFLELTNASLLMHKIYSDFAKFSEDFNEINLNEQFDNQKLLFQKHLREIANFTKTVDAKLEFIAERYYNFGNDMATMQQDQLNGFDTQLKDYVKNSKLAIEKISTALKFMKGGLIGLIITTVILCIVSGGLFGYAWSKKQELNDIYAKSEQLENIKVITDKENVIFEFPNNAEFIQKDNVKQIKLNN